ncbi:hypothetical protein ABIB62_003435 [Mucilaginibacter sp. UYP25]
MFAQKTEVFTSIRIGDMHYSGNLLKNFGLLMVLYK